MSRDDEERLTRAAAECERIARSAPMFERRYWRIEEAFAEADAIHALGLKTSRTP